MLRDTSGLRAREHCVAVGIVTFVRKIDADIDQRGVRCGGE